MTPFTGLVFRARGLRASELLLAEAQVLCGLVKQPDHRRDDQTALLGRHLHPQRLAQLLAVAAGCDTYKLKYVVTNIEFMYLFRDQYIHLNFYWTLMHHCFKYLDMEIEATTNQPPLMEVDIAT